MRFFAECYETGNVAAIIVSSGGVRDLRIMPPRSGALGFEDFAFPLNTSIDHIDLTVREGLVHAIVRGTYGWLVAIVSETFHVEIGPAPDSKVVEIVNS
ncbi:MAG TPA: hypothetical protein VGC72_04610 [Candidatus Elarobacter sp.]